ncbi:MAG: hypothetical protein KAQ89_00905 [Planctomycetes bacterium]|nr:hypothetical protein [Planctomycetota bacterium]
MNPKAMTLKANKQLLLPAFVILGSLCLFLAGSKSGSQINEQSQAGIQNGMLVIPVQLERDGYGLAMIDTVNETLLVYQLSSRGSAHNRLKLLAARSFKYDRMLQQYNTAEPKPQQVKMLLENMGQQQIEIDEDDMQDPNFILKTAEPINTEIEK